MSAPDLGKDLPPRLKLVKEEIASSYPDFEARATAAWADLLGELEKVTATIASEGTKSVPEVDFSDLNDLSPEAVQAIRDKGCLMIKNVVDDDEARSWQTWLREYVASNPNVEGFPDNDKQFFQLYWTRSQVRGRSHPNVLAATSWLNNTYHFNSGKTVENIDPSVPLSYADRFRIRHPGVQWDAHPPHIDGGSIERWEDPGFRACFDEIFSGDWRAHDPYDLDRRVDAKSSLYNRKGQATIFRTYQGWLALSETAPNEGTLQVFPNVKISNAYLILRPFFAPIPGSDYTSFDPKNWKFDLESHDFPGIYVNVNGTGFRGPMPNPETHPHLRLETSMVSVPKVSPGDMVFWHCDMIHSVEKQHTGTGDSTVMYIPAVPSTPHNTAYVARQKESFLKGLAPPDFPPTKGEYGNAGAGKPDDIESPIGKTAMGFAIEVV